MIIPLIKNKSGDATDKHNYLPIAISATMSKVLERLMLHKIDSYLYTTDNQFGFKQNHGRPLYWYVYNIINYALRQTIDYYKRNSSPVFICYLDASKAFDRVNYWRLYKKNSLIETSLSPLSDCLCDDMVLNCTVFDGAISYLMVLQVRMVLRKEEFFLRGF